MTRPSHIALRVALFTGIALLIHVGLREASLNWALATSKFSALDRQFDDRSEACNLALVGNSHVLLGLRHVTVPGTYTLGSLGEGHMVTYYRLKKILSRDERPIPVVVTQLDLITFSSRMLTQTRNPYWGQHVDYFDVARRRGDIWLYMTRWARYQQSPYAGHGRAFVEATAVDLGIMASPEEDLDRDFSQMPRRLAQARERARYQFEPPWWDEGMAEYFTDMLDLCQAHDVKVALVMFPMTREYVEEAQTFVPLDEWESRTKPLLEGRDVIVLDYRDLFMDRPDMFFDPDHLNTEGSRVLSARLSEDLEKLGLVPAR